MAGGVEGEAVPVAGAGQPADPVPGLEDAVVGPRLLEGVGGAESGEAGAEDEGGGGHAVSPIPHGPLAPNAVGERGGLGPAGGARRHRARHVAPRPTRMVAFLPRP